MQATAQKLPWYAEGDPWVLTQQAWTPEKNLYYETIFTQSNGYLGVRGYTEEAVEAQPGCREAYLAGVFGEVDDAAMGQLRVNYPWPMVQMLTLPELFGCAILLGGEEFTLAKGVIGRFRRSLDMRNGVLQRDVVWTGPSGRRTRLLFERFLSAAVPHLAMQRITLTPENWCGQAQLRFQLDGDYLTYFRCGDRAMAHLPQALMQEQKIEESGPGLACLGFTLRGTGHAVAVASGLAGGTCTLEKAGGKKLVQNVDLLLQEGQAGRVLHSLAIASSRDRIEAGGVPVFTLETAGEAMRAGYEQALAESEVVWKYRWGLSDLALDGPARDQAYVRFSAFSMLQMAPFHTDNMSIPARAYAYNRYHGLYYWDSETFLLPNYLHTHPEVAENLLSFRYHTLDGARRTARQLKSAGACYPWMTDADSGNEQAPWGIGDYVWHQNADIAYAIDQYVNATGNTGFMLEKGLEVMVESARFWMSRFEEDAAGVVHLHDTVGPDELDKHGKDNGYSSLMARRHLRMTVKWLERIKAAQPAETQRLVQKLELGSGEVAGWVRAAERMAVPNVPGTDFPLQDEFLLGKEPLAFDGLTADEAFAMRHTHRVVKQADIVLALYLLQDEFTVEQMRAAYDFYEPMCLHYSSLSYNTHSILATKIGRDDQAYDYFMKAAGLDLDNLRDATKDGLHAAALGGTWQTIVYGFLGMRLETDGIVFEPRLPKAWNSLTLRIVYRGYRLKLEIAQHEHRIVVESSDCPVAAKVTLNGEQHDLADGLSIRSTASTLKS